MNPFNPQEPRTSQPEMSAGSSTVSSPHHPGISVRLEWAAATHTGLVRANNQDSYVASPPVFAVADGMGGHSAGEVASGAVAARLAALATDGFVEPGSIDEALRTAVSDIEETAATESEAGIDKGTGTTVTGAAVDVVNAVPQWLVFNIGDSRVYYLEDDDFVQVTIDHSVVQELVEAGKITQAEAGKHPYGNVITRAVGFNEEPRPDYVELPLTRGMRMLMCSDGLSKELTDHGIRHFLAAGLSPAATATALVDAALGNGGRDNVTVVVVDVIDAALPTDTQPVSRAD